MKPERGSSVVWPIACMALFVSGVTGVIPNGAVLAIGPMAVALWFLAVSERFRRRD